MNIHTGLYVEYTGPYCTYICMDSTGPHSTCIYMEYKYKGVGHLDLVNWSRVALTCKTYAGTGMYTL